MDYADISSAVGISDAISTTQTLAVTIVAGMLVLVVALSVYSFIKSRIRRKG